MELFFLLVLILIMATALGSGYPVAFALPGAAILTIVLAAIAGFFAAGNSSACWPPQLGLLARLWLRWV